MKFKSTDEFMTFDFNDSLMKTIKITNDQLMFGAEGVIVKANNSNNQRFEDMFTVYLEMTFRESSISRFDEQGYKYFNANGELLNEVPDRALSEAEQKEVIAKVNNGDAKIFLVEKGPDREGYEIIFDVEDEGEDTSVTYQIFFDFKSSQAQWERFSGPVNEHM